MPELRPDDKVTIVIQIKQGAVKRVIADRAVRTILMDLDTDDDPRFIDSDVSLGVVMLLAMEAESERDRRRVEVKSNARQRA
jgi:hypothetical protein